MSWARTSVRGTLTAVVVMSAVAVSAVACTAGSVGGAQESPSCALRFVYQNRTYQDVANVRFTVGEKLGTATQPPCDDTGPQDGNAAPTTTGTVYAVDGLPPLVAVAVGDSPEEAALFAVYAGPDLPPEVRRLRDSSPAQ
ncbi:DUF6281 family protein [Streptomyces sp. NPDC048560]|uniref:DUF6281 family protein n=1 Tax=Streptomyces sp. NPDC048560 TaxID=3155488 RepID=UPI00343AF25E